MKNSMFRAKLMGATRALFGALAQSASEQDILQASIEALKDLLQVRYGAIGMLDEQGKLKQFVHTGLSPEEVGKIAHLPSGKGLLGVVIQKNVLIRLDDMAKDRRSVGFPDSHPCMTSLLAVPISCFGRVYGRIYLCDRSDKQAFSDEDEELALNFANALALALDKERMLAELRQQQSNLVHSAYHDPLTNLPNRVLLSDRLNQVLSQASRNQTRAAILFCDLDDFKIVNDTLGHQVGDHVLKTVSERLVHCLREEDTVARIGGDEFVFVLSNVESAEHTRIVAQKILDVMSQVVNVGDREITLSCSVGIAVFPFDGDATERLIMNADRAMYKAKESGKNNFRFFSDPSYVDSALQAGLLEQGWSGASLGLHQIS